MSTDISDLNGRPVIIGGGAAGLMTTPPSLVATI